MRGQTELSCCSFLVLVLLTWGRICEAESPSNLPLSKNRQQSKSIQSISFHQRYFLNISRGGGTTKRTATKQPQKTSPSSPSKKTADASSGATILTSIFNLSNNVAGAGILTLAAGKASGNTGWIPSIMICTILAFVSAHTFGLIGRSCELTGEETFKGLWASAFGKPTAWVVDSMVFIQCFFVSIIYTGLLGDIFSALMQSSSSLPSLSRTSVILTASAAVLWPLNQIRDLSALGFTSILGLVAVLYTVIFVVVRSLDGTYALDGGKFVADLTLLPSFEKSTFWGIDFNALVLISNLGLAFISHYNGPSYWKSLANATSTRFTKVAMSAYAILATIYVTFMCAGYATFGDVCQGNILLNYSARDMLSTLGRLATGLSIIFGFPLISNGAREGLKNASSALGILPSISDPKNHLALVTCLLLVTTCLSIVLSDIKLVAGLTGAVMGSSLVYICPTMIYAKLVRQRYGSESLEYRMARRNLLLIPFGIFTALMGVTMTLKNTIWGS